MSCHVMSCCSEYTLLFVCVIGDLYNWRCLHRRCLHRGCLHRRKLGKILGGGTAKWVRRSVGHSPQCGPGAKPRQGAVGQSPPLGEAFLLIQTIYTVCQNNVPTLESCTFDKHGVILIVFGTQHQHTFKNDLDVQLSLSLHLYLLYLLFSSCDGNNAFWRSCMLVKQFSSFSRKHRTLYLQICVCQTVRLTTEFVDWCRNVYIVQSPVRDTSRCDQPLKAAPH